MGDFTDQLLLLINFSVYRDLLAVTSASTMVQLRIKFEKPPVLKLQEFLSSTLKFVQLNDDVEQVAASVSFLLIHFPLSLNYPSKQPRVEQSINFSDMIYTEQITDYEESQPTKDAESFFFYCDDHIFKGVLVRVKVIDQLSASLKVYIRY